MRRCVVCHEVLPPDRHAKHAHCLDRPTFTGRPEPYGWWLFLPGEEARCPAKHPDHPGERCAHYLMDLGPICLRVRAAVVMPVGERRSEPRAHMRCSKCGVHLELDFVLDEGMKPAA